MSVVAHKMYLVDKKPFFQHFHARPLTITAVRTVATQGLMIFNGFVASLDLEETDSEDETASEDEDELDKLKKKVNKSEKEEFVPPTKEEFATTCLISFTKSLSITTCLRTLEELALKLFRPQVVNKFVKDLSKSAMRKYARHHSRLTAASYMLKTGMRGNVLTHISMFLVEEAHQVILILYRRYRSTPKGKHLRNAEDDLDKEKNKNLKAADVPERTFLQITAKNATRVGVAVVSGGIGAAVGTMIRPGLGTVIGAVLGDNIAYMI